jgi:hypothetical protein
MMICLEYQYEQLMVPDEAKSHQATTACNSDTALAYYGGARLERFIADLVESYSLVVI